MEVLKPVKGQEDLCRKLASTFSQFSLYLNDRRVGKPVACVYGPSGTGKTFAVELLCEHFGLPFTSVSATSLSMTAYKGLTFRGLLVQHKTENNGADYGVIFVDEMDKWCRNAMGGNDHEVVTQGTRMQDEALRMIQGEKVVLSDEMEPEEGETQADITIDTRNLLWVLGGAFVGLDRQIRRHLSNVHFLKDEIWSHARASDFVGYGMINELAGRINTWAWAYPLKYQHMLEILQEQELPRWDLTFKAIGCELQIEQGALSRCIDLAIDEKTGVRTAIAMLRRGMEDIYYEASKHRLTQVTVTPAMILTGQMEVEVDSAV